MLGAFLQFEVHLPLWLPESELDVQNFSRAFQHATELFVKSIGSLVPTLLVILMNSREISNWPCARARGISPVFRLKCILFDILRPTVAVAKEHPD